METTENSRCHSGVAISNNEIDWMGFGNRHVNSFYSANVRVYFNLHFVLTGMVNILSQMNCCENMTFVSIVGRDVFADRTNWGRIASLVAFGAVLCQHMKERGRTNCVELACQTISTYLLTEQREWLMNNNSWDGSVDFFRVADPESTVRNILQAFAGFAGIVATLAFLIKLIWTLKKLTFGLLFC
uniref:Bcl-2 Bcl-2 homology region 1-3 domain-containing protein n=1 Tax=Gouania willdenowi TaxID=441366 RepID=A0A8C5GAN3_GOUWI